MDALLRLQTLALHLSAPGCSDAAASVDALHTSAAGDALRGIAAKQLDGIREAGTFKKERVITTPQAGQIAIDGVSKPVLNFCANNYLGLSNHPALVAAAKAALDSHGYGLSSVRCVYLPDACHRGIPYILVPFTDSFVAHKICTSGLNV